MTINNNKNTSESSQGDGGATPPPSGQTQTVDNLSSRGGNTIFKSGPLFILSKGIGGWTSWKKRWFILTRTSLVFFRSDPNAITQRASEVNLTLGGIDLNNSGSVVVKADKKLLTVLFPDGRDGRAFTLKAETSEDLYEWKNALESALAEAPNAALVMGQNGIFKNDQVNGKDAPSDQCLLTDKPPAKSLVIGRPILLALEDVDGSPSFLEKALRFIEEHGVKVEGILRQAADVDDVERRIREYEQGKMVFLPEEDAHIVGDCIKYFLRELPSSPVPASCCNALIEACRTDRVGRVNAMRAAICETFPEPNRRLLERILSMMQKVAIHKAVNRMSTSAVAACMAPLLLRPLLSGDCEIETNFNVGGDGSIQLLQAAAAANHAQAIVITLLEEYDSIFREGSMTPGLYSDSEEDASEDEEVTDDDEFYEDDEHDDASEESDTDTDYDLDNASGGTCSESGGSEEENLSDHEVGNDLVSGSESHEVDSDSKAHKELPPSSIESPLPLHVDLERSRDILDKSDNDPETQTNKPAELVGDGSKEISLENMLTGSNPSTCIQKSASIPNAPEHGTRHRTVWGRTAARKNLSMEAVDYAFEDEVEIEKLEACKIDLQNKISKEVKSNAVLHANLEQRKKDLHEQRQSLEQDLARLQEQLQQERDKRTLLEAALNNSQEPLPSNLMVDDKMKIEFEEISQAEADIINLKQKVNDLNLQLNEQIDQNNGSAHDSINQSNSSNPPEKVSYGCSKDKNKDIEYTTGPNPGKSSSKEYHMDRTGSDNDKKHESPSSRSKHSQQSEAGRSSNSRSSANTRRSSRSEAMNSTAYALTKLTTRLNFLKERRTQIANELHNLDKGRSSNQSTAVADKGKASESCQSVQNMDKSQGLENSTPEKGLATESQTLRNLENSRKPEAQSHPDAPHTENVSAGRSDVQGSRGKTSRSRRTNSR